MNSTKIKKTLIKLLPYIIVGLVCTNLGEAWRLAEGADMGKKMLSFFSMVGVAFGNPLPSLHPLDLLVGTICGGVLYQQRYQTDKRKQDCYICGSYKKRTTDCTAHFIRTDHLAAGVTENIRKITNYAAKHEARFRKLLIEQNEDGGKKKNAARRKELDAAEKRITELSAIFKRLYEDSVAGRITDERFTELSADYEAEQKQLKDRAAELEAELSKAQEATANADRFLKVIQKDTGFEELTHTLLREFVEKIVVHECYHDESGIRRQDVDIYYNFVGKVDLPE